MHDGRSISIVLVLAALHMISWSWRHLCQMVPFVPWVVNMLRLSTARLLLWLGGRVLAGAFGVIHGLGWLLRWLGRGVRAGAFGVLHRLQSIQAQIGDLDENVRRWRQLLHALPAAGRRLVPNWSKPPGQVQMCTNAQCPLRSLRGAETHG